MIRTLQVAIVALFTMVFAACSSSNEDTLPKGMSKVSVSGGKLSFDLSVGEQPGVRVGLTDADAPRLVWSGADVEVKVLFKRGTRMAVGTGTLSVKGVGANLTDAQGNGSPRLTVPLPASFTESDVLSGECYLAGIVGAAEMDNSGKCTVASPAISVGESMSANDHAIPLYFPLTAVTTSGGIAAHMNLLGSLIVIKASTDLTSSLSPTTLRVSAGDAATSAMPFSSEGVLDLATTTSADSPVWSAYDDALIRKDLTDCTIPQGESRKIVLWVMPKTSMSTLPDLYYYISDGTTVCKSPVKAGKILTAKSAYRWEATASSYVMPPISRFSLLNVGEVNHFANGSTSDAEASVALQQSGEGSRYYQYGRNYAFTTTPDAVISQVDNPSGARSTTAFISSYNNWYNGGTNSDTWTSVNAQIGSGTGNLVGVNSGDPSPEGYRLPTGAEMRALFPTTFYTSSDVSEEVSPTFDGSVQTLTTDYYNDNGTIYALKMKGTEYATANAYNIVYSGSTGYMAVTSKKASATATIDEIRASGYFTTSDATIYIPGALSFINEAGSFVQYTYVGNYWSENNAGSTISATSAWALSFGQGWISVSNGNSRSRGYTLRPIRRTAL